MTADLWRQLEGDWSRWLDLEGCWLGDTVPALPGLYRIGRIGSDGLDYIGQTGAGTMTLKKRLGMLRGIYRDPMPYRDPHTAAPCLWALRKKLGCEFEVSTLPVEGDTQWRKGVEAAAIALYRQETGASPTANFGRMPEGYSISSGNTTRLRVSGKRRRGAATTESLECHLPGVAPTGPLQGSPVAGDWAGHTWSRWVLLSEAVEYLGSAALGLYRIRERQSGKLLYVGEGRIRDRLQAHTARERFSGRGEIEVSLVENDVWYKHQRLELENDLIAAHLLTTSEVPAVQFVG